jgi:hypothetical protein
MILRKNLHKKKEQMKSDIFESYARILNDKKIPKDESNSRTKDPGNANDLKYENNIMEVAHPEPAIVFPAYDKLNGLVENNIERQNIMLHLINRKPTGQLFNTKNADQELLLTLVKIGNHLDAIDNVQLRTLADSCLEKISIKKQAIAPLAIAGLSAAVSLLGFIYANQHLSNSNHGYEKNYQKLISSVDALLNSSSQMGVGYDLDQTIMKDMKTFKSYLNSFNTIYLSVKPFLDTLQTPRTAQELMEMANKLETNEILDSYKKFKTAAENLFPYIRQVKSNFSSSTYKDTHIKEKGMLTSLVDYVGLHGGKGLTSDIFDEVVMAIDPFYESINEILTVLKNADNFKAHAMKQLEESNKENPVNQNDSKTKQNKIDINDPNNLGDIEV